MPTDHDVTPGNRRAHRRNTRSRGALGAASVLIALSLTALACTKTNAPTSQGATSNGNQQAGAAANQLEPEETPKSGGKLVVAVTGETNGWNPGVNQWADAGVVVGASVLETLMTFDEEGGWKPYLAESMEPTRAGDFTSWTLKLKPGIKLHNGEKLDAKLVKKNIDYVHLTAALSSLALKDYYEGTTAKDDLTLEIKLKVNWASYPTVLAGQTGMIMAAAMLDAEDQGVKAPIGTGPFVFESWIPDTSFKAKKNPDYWQKGLPYLDAIEFLPIVDSQTRINALRSGQVDIVMTNRAGDVARAKEDFAVIKDWNSEKTHLLLNTLEDPTKKRNPLKNVHARRALAYATNRELLINTIAEGEDVQSSTTPIVASTKFKMDEADTGYYPYDQAKAREEIELYKKDTGYEDFSFEFSGLANQDDIAIMQNLQQQWKEVGIECNISTVEQTAYISQLVLGGYQVGYFRNYAYPDPDSNYFFWSSDTAKGLGVLSINFTQYKSDRVDAALAKGRSSADPAARRDAYIELTKGLNEGAVNTWLFNTAFSLITQKNVRGLNQARKQGFGNFLPKPWLLPTLWRAS